MGVLLQKQNPKNIIVRMPNWIGDLVMATPVLAALKEKYPDASLTVMCQKPLGDLLEKDPHVDEIFSFQKPSTFWRRLSNRSIISKLRQGKYDLGVLLTNSFSSAWLFWRGKVKNRLGFIGDGRSFFLNQAAPFPELRKNQHLVKTYLELLKPLGIEGSSEKTALYLDEEEETKAHQFLDRFGVGKNDRLVGVNPGAAYGSAKCWLPDRFADVAKQMLQKIPNSYVLFFGDAGSKNLVSSMCFGPRCINLAGSTNLRELMALIKICTVFLTNDSGPMHMASALGTDLVALFGSTDAIVTGPIKGKVIFKNATCAPCFKRVCPIDFRCMKKIEVDEVKDALMEYVNGTH